MYAAVVMTAADCIERVVEFGGAVPLKVTISSVAAAAVVNQPCCELSFGHN